MMASSSLGVDDLTYTLVPIGGSTVTGGQTVDVELFITTNRAIRTEGTQYDLPCVVTASPGGSGTLTFVSATVDPDGDGFAGPSSGGAPFFTGANGQHPFAPSTCIFYAVGPVGAPAVDVPAGVIRYLGTITYHIDDCAAGDFRLAYECTDQPGGVCDNVPEPTNTTRHREDNPPGGGIGPLVSLELTEITLNVPIGPCCASFNVVPDCNAYCCEVVQKGCNSFRTAAAMCLPATYGDAYPSETNGDGLIDSDDIFCMLSNFQELGACPGADIAPCGGDGMMDVDDVLAMLNTFSGQPPCPDPCQ